MAEAIVHLPMRERSSCTPTEHGKIIDFPVSTRVQMNNNLCKKSGASKHVLGARNQTMEPIESREEVNAVVSYCLEKEQWRNALLFIFGFNTALRISDIIETQMFEVIKENHLVSFFSFVENKKRWMEKPRPVKLYTNQAIEEMLDLYCIKTPNVTPVSYLFENYSRGAALINDSGYFIRPHMSRQAAWKIIKKVTADVGVYGMMGTHTLRKTPVWQILTREPDANDNIVKNPNGLQVAQALLNHSNPHSTLHYTTALQKQLEIEMKRLNLGLEAVREYKIKHGIPLRG